MPVLRPTFEAVGSSQLALLHHLEELEVENRPVKDAAERELLLKEIACSTLGLGVDISFSLFVNERLLLCENLEIILRWASYCKTVNVEAPAHIGHANEYFVTVPISRVWRELREALYGVLPLALKHSVSLSREQEGGAKAKGYTIDG